MKVAFLDPLEARLDDFPKTYLAEHEVVVASERGELPEGVDDAEALVWWAYPVGQELIERLARPRFLQRIGLLRTRGDVSAALAKGMPVSALPFGVSDRVAQHALALTLSILRKLRPNQQAMIAGLNPGQLPEAETGAPSTAVNWTRRPDVDTLNDKTVGVIGFGEIGACLSRLIAPYDCRLLYHKRTRLSLELESYFGVEYASLEEVLSRSDIVTSILPYSEETRKLLGAKEFARMRPSSIFINVGRGNTVDEPALIEALSNGTIAFAGLDVFAVEPLPVSSPFLRMDNVVLSPHSAGGTPGWANTFERIAENLRRVQSGQRLIMPMSAGDPQFGGS